MRKELSATAALKEHRRKYLPGTPRRVPEGYIIVHNRVGARVLKGEEDHDLGRPRHYPGWRDPGEGGFRIWRDKKGRQHRVCKCGWATHLGRHYRLAD